MKNLILAALLFVGQGPNVYPVGYRIESVHLTKHLLTYSGYGTGNVRDENGVRGFDYQFKFCGAIQPTEGRGFGPSRWENAHRLVIVTSEIGTDNRRECTLWITLRDFVYVVRDGHLTTRPLK
jgi:hypothetical protein